MLLLLSVLVGAGCKNNSPAPQSASYFMSATINGKAWQVKGYGTAYFAIYTNSPTGNMLSIMGSDTTKDDTLCRFMSLSFYSKPKIGTYYFNNNGSILAVGGVMATYLYDRGPQTIDKWSTGGHVDISLINDNEIKGDFSCTLEGDANDTTTTTITNGKFDVINE